MCPSWDTFDTRGKVNLNHARELVLGGGRAYTCSGPSDLRQLSAKRTTSFGSEMVPSNEYWILADKVSSFFYKKEHI